MLGEGAGIHPLYLPMHADDGHVAGLIGLLSQEIRDYSDGIRIDRDPEPQHLDLISDARGGLFEGIMTESEDEDLLERFLAGEEIASEAVVPDLERAVARGHFFPVLFTATAPTGFGMAELLEVITRAFPSPLDHALPTVTAPDGTPREPLSCDPSGPLCALVVHTSSDPHVGRVSIVRVFSGTLRPDASLHVSGHSGTSLQPVPALGAGDIGLVAKLAHAETGGTLSSPELPLLIAP